MNNNQTENLEFLMKGITIGLRELEDKTDCAL